MPWRMLAYQESLRVTLAMGAVLAMPLPLVLLRRVPQAIPWVFFW